MGCGSGGVLVADSDTRQSYSVDSVSVSEADV